MAGLLVWGGAPSWAAKSPNLIVIMADDLGYADVGFNGCKDIPTPNIDRIAQNGVRCASGYVTYAVCSPSRAGFITGRYEQRFGHERNPLYRPDDPNMGLPLTEHTLPDLLKPAGYTSGLVGKWHLGAHPTLHPLKRGFDSFFGHLGGGHRYLPEDLTIERSEDATNEEESYKTWILRDHTPVRTTNYLTDAFSDAAVGFIEQNKEKPFFLYVAYNAPHTPLQATEKYLARFPNIEGKRKTYAAMVSAVDDGVGRMLDKLDELKLSDNTIVVFLSDNGGPETKNASDNGMLRGGKGDEWEGGWRVPFAVQWKGTLPKGAVYEKPVSSLDIAATMVALTGAHPDPKHPLDGVNLIPYLTGKKEGAPHEAIYLRKFDQNKFAVRQDDFKLVIPWKGGAPQLYNLQADIGEETNIAAKHPETVRELDKLRDRWNSELVEPRFLGLGSKPERKKNGAKGGQAAD
jgi:arylsulfatase A-like enzyme